MHLGASLPPPRRSGGLQGGLAVHDECWMTSPSATAPEGRICIWPTASLRRRSSGIPTTVQSRGGLCLGTVLDAGRIRQLWVDTPSVLNTVDPNAYNGWYVDASWYLTGETRTYEADTGEFGRPKVKHPVLWGQGGGGWGAWQIAGRYDVINLSDKNNTLVGFAGNTANALQACTFCGDQETWLIGVNWWMNDYTRMALNVTQSKISGGNPLTSPGSCRRQQERRCRDHRRGPPRTSRLEAEPTVPSAPRPPPLTGRRFFFVLADGLQRRQIGCCPLATRGSRTGEISQS